MAKGKTAKRSNRRIFSNTGPLIAGPLPDGGPRPIDTGPISVGFKFEAVIDPALPLSDEAVRRIERSIRQAVLNEVALIDYRGSVQVHRTDTGGGFGGIEVRYIPE